MPQNLSMIVFDLNAVELISDWLWFLCRGTNLWSSLTWMPWNLSLIVFDLDAAEFICDRLWFECRGTNLWLALFWMPMNWSLDPHVTYTITGFSFFHLESDFDYFYELKKSFKLSYPYCIFYKFCFCRNWNLVVVLFFKSLNYFSFQIFRFTFPKKSGCLSPVFYAINIVKKLVFLCSLLPFATARLVVLCALRRSQPRAHFHLFFLLHFLQQ